MQITLPDRLRYTSSDRLTYDPIKGSDGKVKEKFPQFKILGINRFKFISKKYGDLSDTSSYGTEKIFYAKYNKPSEAIFAKLQ